MKKFNILSFVLLIFLLSTGCKKELLEVKNQNQPDFKLVYSNGDDVQNVASGLFNTIFNGMHAFAGTQLMLAVASDNISCSWGKMVLSEPEGFVSATPYGIMLLLEFNHISTKGKHAVVLGRSHIVGRPMSILLSNNSTPGNCTVTVCHSKTENLKEICQQADIIIAAIGQPEFLKADMVKEGAVVIDVGITRVKDSSKKSGYKLVGDVDFENVAPKCSFITPVPGGVGPMTIAALMKNTFKACAENE